MSSQESRPIVGYHSREFQNWLGQQTPERRAEILSGEQRYLRSKRPLAFDRPDPAERDYAESFCGVKDSTAGRAHAQLGPTGYGIIETIGS